ncbi:MAG: ABC transporter permease [Chloroflexi bacterium]|jgi:simple sugar transport system permease protein|nr:ABC transporter permease [Chloroflexota bacterium]
MKKLKTMLDKFGLPRLIIGLFFIVLLVTSLAIGFDPGVLFSDVLRRVLMFSILVLAMIPGVQSGIGMNFGISLGISAGLLGAVLAMEVSYLSSWTEKLGAGNPWLTLLLALAIGITLAAILGFVYGLLLNRVKGSEMTVSTYVGFSVIAFMNIVWLSLTFQNGELSWPLQGKGLRNTASLAGSFGGILSEPAVIQNTQPAGLKWIAFNVGGVSIPLGLILVFILCAFIIWLFLQSKAGIAMSAGGENPTFTLASGINVDRTRILGTVISTVFGAVGIIMYAQTYGFLQLYNAPLMMGFASVAAILIGGASVNRAAIPHVIIGTLLFQGILVTALPVVNVVIEIGTLPEVLRIIISNGIILYALSKAKGGSSS